MWENMHSIGLDTFATSVQQTSDGGFAVAGYTCCLGGLSNSGWVLKLDRDGNMMWEKTYGATADQLSFSVQKTFDGGYVAAGATNDNALILRLDDRGNVVWENTYGPKSSATVVQETSDGGFIVGGSATAASNSPFHPWVFKLDETGNIAWQHSYSQPDLGWVVSLQETSDGEFSVAITSGNRLSASEATVLLLDPDGTIVWQNTYGTTPFLQIHAVQQTRHGGFIVAGTLNAPNGITSEGWVAKLDEQGMVGSSCSIIAPASATVADTSATVTPISSTITDTSSSDRVTSSHAFGPASTVVATQCQDED